MGRVITQQAILQYEMLGSWHLQPSEGILGEPLPATCMYVLWYVAICYAYPGKVYGRFPVF